jgi:membrane fusion protein (multidrug efflux system)
MTRRVNRRKVLYVTVPVLILIAAGVGLLATGRIPLGAGSPAVASDSTAVAEDVAQDGSEEVPVPVELARVEQRSIAAFYRAASVIEADRLVELVAKVSGRVQAIHVEEGDWVEPSQILAELENGREKIQLEQAALKLQDEKRKWERNHQMLAEELISQQEFDAVESAYELAKTERDLAAIALEETYVRAPFAGQITDRKIVLGQQVAVAEPAFTMADFDPLRVRVYLPEAIARKVTAGQRVLVTSEAVDSALPARVERVAPVVDPATSTVRVTLRIDDDSERARVGGFCKVRITTDTHHEALAVPKTALVEQGALQSVFVAEADTVRKVEVRTGLYDESHVEVLDGLLGGEYVVTLGQGGLRTGSLIEALNGAEVGYQTPAAGEKPDASRRDDEEDAVAALTEQD